MYTSYFLFTSLCPVGWRALLPVVCHRSLHCYLHWHGQLWEAACWSTFCGTHADSWTDICPIFYNASGFLMTKIVDSFSFLLNKLCLHQWLTNSQSFVKSVTIHMNCDSSFMDKNAPPSFFVLWEGDLVKWVCFFHLGWALSVNTYGEKCKECYNCVIVFFLIQLIFLPQYLMACNITWYCSAWVLLHGPHRATWYPSNHNVL